MNTPSTDKNKQIEAEIMVAIDELDERHFGLFTVERMGEVGDGLTPLVMGDAEINSDMVRLIQRNADRLGPRNTRLTHVRLKSRRDAEVIEASEPMPKKERIAVFEGIKTSFEDVKTRLELSFDDPEQLFSDNYDEANRKVRELSLNIDPAFRDVLSSAISKILENKDQATLFACLDQYGENTSEHGLRVFMMGIKLIAKVNRFRSDQVYNNQQMLDYGLGLLFHDIGKIFLPKNIQDKKLRIPQKELEEVENQCRLRGVDPKYITIIRAINDPRQMYNRKVETYLSEEVKKMRFLASDGILTLDQYSALRRFPNHSCLSVLEQRMMERHPGWGWEMVRKATQGSPLALDIVKNHHQRLDNSGYPDSLASMTLAAQIAAAVDMFDSMVTDSCYSEARPYVDGFRMLHTLTACDGSSIPKLDRDVYELFCAYIQRYPVGSFLRIDGGQYDGCIGMVTKFDPYNPNTPEFVLFRNRQGQRLTEGLLYHKNDYDDTFRIIALPFTEKIRQQMLCMNGIGVFQSEVE